MRVVLSSDIGKYSVKSFRRNWPLPYGCRNDPQQSCSLIHQIKHCIKSNTYRTPSKLYTQAIISTKQQRIHSQHGLTSIRLCRHTIQLGWISQKGTAVRLEGVNFTSVRGGVAHFIALPCPSSSACSREIRNQFQMHTAQLTPCRSLQLSSDGLRTRELERGICNLI